MLLYRCLEKGDVVMVKSKDYKYTAKLTASEINALLYLGQEYLSEMHNDPGVNVELIQKALTAVFNAE